MTPLLLHPSDFAGISHRLARRHARSLVKKHLDKVEQLLAAGDDVEVLLGGADDGEDDLEADVLLGVVLAELEGVGDVADELWGGIQHCCN